SSLTPDSIVLLSYREWYYHNYGRRCQGPPPSSESRPPGTDPPYPGRRRRGGPDLVPRARVCIDDHRGDQRPVGYPAGDGVPAVLLEDRDPQGSARCLDRG